jgi:hypothetical protein
MSTTALAPITADSNLTFFCWSTLTTPFGPGLSATSAKRPFAEVAQDICRLPSERTLKTRRLSSSRRRAEYYRRFDQPARSMQCFAD